MDYSVRSGRREDLVATLRQFAADRAERGETRRAAEATEAADALERGADQAYFERIVYVVGDPDRWAVVSGDRAHVLAELKDSAVGWDHFGNEALAGQAVDAYEHVEQGADLVRVGHLLYVVVE